jgi:hypothetical protein
MHPNILLGQTQINSQKDYKNVIHIHPTSQGHQSQTLNQNISTIKNSANLINSPKVFIVQPTSAPNKIDYRNHST